MQNNLFEEKQYLGLNKMSIFRRMALAIFCFLLFYWRENQEKSGDLFFLLGILILLISLILLFILHFETRVLNGSIILDGLWTARKVKIDIKSLRSAEKVKYSRYFFNRAVYNLHFKGVVRFYSRGNEAIKLIDKDGLIYLIGTQRSDDLLRIINNDLNYK